MSKIKRIQITNFKAIDAHEADFNGCPAIITGGTNRGKTSFLRGIPDRIRGIRPELITKQGEQEGNGMLVLTTGERFEWDFNDTGKDSLKFFTKDGYKSAVTKEIVQKFFPAVFDIDKFLLSSPKEQAKQLQKIIGIDFTEIDARYKAAYDARTEKNKESERCQSKLNTLSEVPETAPVDLTDLQTKKQAERDRLNNLYTQNKEHNEKLRKDWNKANQDITDAENERINRLYTDNKLANDRARNNWLEAKHNVDIEVKAANDESNRRAEIANACIDSLSVLCKHGYTGSEVKEFIDEISVGILTEDKIPVYPAEPKYLQEKFDPEYNLVPEPTYIQEMPDAGTLDAIDKQILEASENNAKAQAYKQYLDQVTITNAAKSAAFDADVLVKAVEDERNQLIETANFPKGIAITSDGITVDGFPMDRNQISTSKLYCTALRIASMNLGEVKTLHFDASFLDRNSLSEIEAWATENELQLLIERPDFDGGEIKYELLEN